MRVNGRLVISILTGSTNPLGRFWWLVVKFCDHAHRGLFWTEWHWVAPTGHDRGLDRTGIFRKSHASIAFLGNLLEQDVSSLFPPYFSLVLPFLSPLCALSTLCPQWRSLYEEWAWGSWCPVLGALGEGHPLSHWVFSQCPFVKGSLKAGQGSCMSHRHMGGERGSGGQQQRYVAELTGSLHNTDGKEDGDEQFGVSRELTGVVEIWHFTVLTCMLSLT